MSGVGGYLVLQRGPQAFAQFGSVRVPVHRHRVFGGGADDFVGVARDGQCAVGFAGLLNRASREFTADDRELMTVLRAPLLSGLMRTRSRARARMALRSPSVEALARLTDAEVQVLELVALGRTNQAIADARNISPRTVAKHLEHIYRKLEVDNRAAAAGLAANTSARPDGSAGMRTSGVSPMAGRATPRANFLS